jgi:hypothetical protein
MSEAKHIYQAIATVTGIMASEGIAKSRRNEQQGYAFRGIDEVYAALSVHLADQKLCILPRVMDRTATERATLKGGVATYTILTVEFDLVSAVDGSTHTIRTVGEAMDTADKSSNKAMSAAMKYACLMAFQIPTEGDNDADRHHPQKAVPRNSAGAGRPTPARGTPLSGQTPRAEVANDDAEWLEWAMRHTISMKNAQTAGELKAAFSEAWREAGQRGAPDHIRSSLKKAKDDLKGVFSEAS